MKNRIKECRKEVGMAQEKLGKVVGLTKQTISKYENGDREPSIAMWEKLATVLNVTPAYLVGWTDEKPDGATVYLNDREASYVDLDCLNSIDERFANGRDNFGNEVHIPIHSILYIEKISIKGKTHDS